MLAYAQSCHALCVSMCMLLCVYGVIVYMYILYAIPGHGKMEDGEMARFVSHRRRPFYSWLKTVTVCDYISFHASSSIPGRMAKQLCIML